MKTSVALRYNGPAVDDGRMDVYQAAANMVAFSDFMVAATKATYGNDAVATAQVRGFERGSFETNLVINIAGSAATIFTALTPDQLWEVVKHAFSLWKHLKGEPPKAIEQNANQTVEVTNNNGNILNVRADALHLVMHPPAASAVQTFVRGALAHEGVESLTINPSGRSTRAIVTTSAEATYFLPVAPQAMVSDHVARMVLVIVTATFVEGNRWRFSDGGAPFSAAIEDTEFLDRVDRGGERFGKGDVLDADVRIIQTHAGGKLSVERSVLKVHRHIVPDQQAGLDLGR